MWVLIWPQCLKYYKEKVLEFFQNALQLSNWSNEKNKEWNSVQLNYQRIKNYAFLLYWQTMVLIFKKRFGIVCVRCGFCLQFLWIKIKQDIKLHLDLNMLISEIMSSITLIIPVPLWRHLNWKFCCKTFIYTIVHIIILFTY